jgi:hypothetical protein
MTDKIDKNAAMTSLAKTLYLFEKEKGGVGSTGTLVTIAHMLMLRGTPVEFIEASTSQLDVFNAYGDHHEVHQLALTDADASDRLIDLVAAAPPGAAILANVPGGRFEEMDEVHQLVGYALETGETDARVVIVWTMGMDAASRITLDAMLDGAPPGPVWLNLPEWAGPPDKFVNIDDELLQRIKGNGGCVFVTPKMPPHLYEKFRSEEVAIDRIAARPGTTIGNRAALGLWERKVAQALGDIF